MKVRRTILAAAGCAAMTALISASVSACSGSPSSNGPTPAAGASVPAPAASPTGVTTGTARASAPGVSHPATATFRPSGRASVAPAYPASSPATAHPSASPVPSGPPATGGGGTAGVQDVTLFVLGGAAIGAGIGVLAYRRRLTRGS